MYYLKIDINIYKILSFFIINYGCSYKRIFHSKDRASRGKELKFERMIMEKESPEELGYDKIQNNLTESSIRDRNIKDLGIIVDDLILSYEDHSGIPELRETIAQDYHNVSSDSILVTTGACMAIFITYITLLNNDDHVLVINPNYATNIEIPKSLGINMDLLTLTFEEQFSLDLEKLERMIKPSTKLISITYPHNPTGAMIDEKTLLKVIQLAENNNSYLLVDETYRELTMGKKLSQAASLSDKAISVESMSKSFGIPGIRVGWIATQSSFLKEKFLAAMEQICICGSVVDEEIALHVLNHKNELMKGIKMYNKKAFRIVSDWIENQKELEWIEPKGGVVCFPRIKPNIKISIDKFYNILNNKYGTYVGPGHWFGHDDHYFRIGYSWPLEQELKDGLQSIINSIKESKI